MNNILKIYCNIYYAKGTEIRYYSQKNEQVNTQMKNEKSNRILFGANKMPVFSIQKMFNEHIVSKIQLPSVNKCLKKIISYTPLPTSFITLNPLLFFGRGFLFVCMAVL